MTIRLFSHHLTLRCWATKYTDAALSARSNSNSNSNTGRPTRSSLSDLLLLVPNSKNKNPSTRRNNLTWRQQKRTLSYYTGAGGGGGGGGINSNSSRNLRAFPSYTIYGETSVLQVSKYK